MRLNFTWGMMLENAWMWCQMTLVKLVKTIMEWDHDDLWKQIGGY
jgi:hypothetical protein